MISSKQKDTVSVIKYYNISANESFFKKERKRCTVYLRIYLPLFLLLQVSSITSLEDLQCTSLENKRFDCWPETEGATEEKCQSRGCCWKKSSMPGTAPYCFFPLNYNGYYVTALAESKTGIDATLVRNTTTFFSRDAKTIKLIVEFISESILRIKLFDPNDKRYEVPFEVSPVHSAPRNLQYTVDVEKGPFNIHVRRRSTGETLFNTNGTAPLIFSDQYLQIATQLSTKYFYGLGEHRSNFLHDLRKWERLVFWNVDDVPKVDNNGYGTHPFLVNLEEGRDGNNMGNQNNSHGIFLLNSNAGEVSLQPYGENRGAITYRFIGGILDFYIMAGPEPVSVVQQYLSIIGRPYMPPFWSLGFHLCRWGYNSSSYLKQVIDRNRDAKMPYDVQWNDIDYMMDHKDWTIGKAFSSLPDVVKDLHNNSQRYIIIVDPAISSQQQPGSYPPFDDGKNMDIFVKNSNDKILIGKVWPGLTAFPDFFHPNASTYLYKQASAFHKFAPFDGLWIDMNEPSSFVKGSTIGCTQNSLDNPPYVPPTIDFSSLMVHTVCPSAKQYLSNHYNLHNMYGWSNAKASRKALNRLFSDKRSLLITRSSFAGSGTFTGHWLGDNYSGYDDLYFSIPGILNFNLFGIPQIGADICGFRGVTSPELCTRWMQLGAFYPFMRNHNTLQSPDQDPAVFPSPYKDYMRSALQLRYRLLSVLYTLFYQSHTLGMPVVRPLLFMYPGTESIDRQFMWGDQLMISPVLEEGKTSVSAFIPNDVWYDFYNGSQLRSVDQYVTLDAPLDRINVHVRGGSILTLLPHTLRTDYSRKEKFEIIIAPSSQGVAVGSLFWDDGESQSSISSGQYSEVLFSFKNWNLLSVLPQKTGFNPPGGVRLGTVIALNVAHKPSTITVNGKTVTADYDNDTKKLSISNLDEDLLTRFDVSWV